MGIGLGVADLMVTEWDWGKWVAFESDCLAETLSGKLQSLVMINIIALTNLTMLRCVLIITCAAT